MVNTIDKKNICIYIKKFLQDHFWFSKFREKVVKFFKKIGFCVDKTPSSEIVFKKRYSDRYIIYIFTGLSKNNPVKSYYPMFYIDLYLEHRFMKGEGIYLPKSLEDVPCFFKKVEQTINQYVSMIYRDATQRTIEEQKKK